MQSTYIRRTGLSTALRRIDGTSKKGHVHVASAQPSQAWCPSSWSPRCPDGVEWSSSSRHHSNHTTRNVLRGHHPMSRRAHPRPSRHRPGGASRASQKAPHYQLIMMLANASIKAKHEQSMAPSFQGLANWLIRPS